ncbi:MAG: hypothetical protein JRE36_14825 [Deltaproteobacteria bacterium]|nr:hypothetical protein [Deltaproteobacteria bacterium]
MARYIGPVIQLWVAQRLEADLGLARKPEKDGYCATERCQATLPWHGLR